VTRAHSYCNPTEGDSAGANTIAIGVGQEALMRLRKPLALHDGFSDARSVHTAR